MITMLTFIVYETYAGIFGVFNTPDWLINWYEKVADFWMMIVL